MKRFHMILLAAFLTAFTLPASADSTPEASADAFHAALASGDEKAVEMLLASDVKILEGGHAQTSRADYMAGHMKSDMAFMPHMQRTVLDRTVNAAGDTAWIVTFSRLKGTYNHKDYDLASRELLVMERAGTGWRITLVHWTDK